MQIDTNWIESRKEAIFQQQNIALAWSSLDIVLAEITRLREALKAAKAFVAEELELRKGDLWEDDSKARDCLAMIEAALGKETGI